jgi:hypothetical protein
MRRYIFILFLVLCVVVDAQKLDVSHVYNPKTDGQNSFVSDANNVLSK